MYIVFARTAHATGTSCGCSCDELDEEEPEFGSLACTYAHFEQGSCCCPRELLLHTTRLPEDEAKEGQALYPEFHEDNGDKFTDLFDAYNQLCSYPNYFSAANPVPFWDKNGPRPPAITTGS